MPHTPDYRSDLGKKFGLLTVTRYFLKTIGKGKDRHTHYECSCECGGTATVLAYSVRNGLTISCGCHRNYAEYIGKKYGRLTILGFTLKQITGQQSTFFDCLCDCGKTPSILVGAVLNGRSRSCGCITNYHSYALSEKRGGRHPLYKKWQSMRNRCLNPGATGYKNYGGRGITIDPRWDDPRNFINDMLPTWKPGLTLDRKDNDGNYTKNNCRFVDKLTQDRNRRGLLLVDTPSGKLCLSEAVEKYGIIGYPGILKRIGAGMDPWLALTTPQQPTGNKPGPNAVFRDRTTCPKCHYRSTTPRVLAHKCPKG